MARARLTVDLDAVAANWRALDAVSDADVETAAVVKADAYGLGAEIVGPALHRAGARTFFVALAEEGAALRAALGPGPRIFVFAGLMQGDARLCRQNDLVPLLNSPEQARRYLSDLAGHPYGLQLDTGMNRLGIEPMDVAPVLEKLQTPPVLTISHLACADTPEHPQNAAQLARFQAMAPQHPMSLAATGGILLGAPYHFQMTRPGIGLYGGLPFAEAQAVVTLSLPVIQTREVEVGETVGYGAAWTAERPSRIATLSAGYADGLIRAMGNRARVLAGPTPCPVVGRVSMDLLTVDVTHLETCPASLDILNAHQTVDDLAKAAGTIGYEILTSLGVRYERVYKASQE